MPATGSKGAPKNPRELKDDTSSSREEKQVMRYSWFHLLVYVVIRNFFGNVIRIHSVELFKLA